VCGTGFEDRTQVLKRLAARWRLFGNGAEVVAEAKSPEFLSSMCADLGIPFPKISLSKPSTPTGWLAKRKGGAGGTHIKPASQSRNTGGEVYYQRKVSGTPIAAFFLADGERAAISAQWSSPTPRQPYRYGGAVRPTPLAPRTADSLSAAVHRIATAMSLVGLNSADFLVDGERFGCWKSIQGPARHSTFSKRRTNPSLHSIWRLVPAKLVTASRHPSGAKAAEIVYAEDDIPSLPSCCPCATVVD
jgi:hypothetical protein